MDFRSVNTKYHSHRHYSDEERVRFDIRMCGIEQQANEINTAMCLVYRFDQVLQENGFELSKANRIRYLDVLEAKLLDDETKRYIAFFTCEDREFHEKIFESIHSFNFRVPGLGNATHPVYLHKSSYPPNSFPTADYKRTYLHPRDQARLDNYINDRIVWCEHQQSDDLCQDIVQAAADPVENQIDNINEQLADFSLCAPALLGLEIR
jgi:hypothetical protein